MIDEIHEILKNNYENVSDSIKNLLENNICCGFTGTIFYNNFNSLFSLYKIFEPNSNLGELINILDDFEKKENYLNFEKKILLLKQKLFKSNQIDFYFNKVCEKKIYFIFTFLKLIKKNEFDELVENKIKNPVLLEKITASFLIHPKFLENEEKNLVIENKIRNGNDTQKIEISEISNQQDIEILNLKNDLEEQNKFVNSKIETENSFDIKRNFKDNEIDNESDIFFENDSLKFKMIVEEFKNLKLLKKKIIVVSKNTSIFYKISDYFFVKKNFRRR